MFPHQLAYVIQEFIEEKEMPIPQGIKENYLTTQQPTLSLHGLLYASNTRQAQEATCLNWIDINMSTRH